MDRVIEYLVGDGPQNRYALICQQCFSHNGMALKEEFEYVAYRCAYCYFLNPARKTRPQAPRLPEFSVERRTAPDQPVPGPSSGTEDGDPPVPGPSSGPEDGDPPVPEPSSGPEHDDPPRVPDEGRLEDAPPGSELQSQESQVTEEVPSEVGPGTPELGNSPAENTAEELDVSQMEVE